VTVLVTGGAGFIGSHIVEALLDAGIAVRVLDRCTQSLDPRAEVVAGDIRESAVVQRAVAGVDAVCHQAAKVGLGVDFGDAGDYVSTNDAGTATLLDALWRRRFRGRFVLASSMVVYGEGRSRCAAHGVVTPPPRLDADLRAGRFEAYCPEVACGRELAWESVGEDTACDPRNVYAATKLHQEHLCTIWGRETGASVVALRYHNVYGPRMPRDTPYAGVMSIFRSAILAGRSPTVFEDGGQTRDFVHVRDVARANVLALTVDDVDPGAYNIASGAPRTVGDVAAALCDAAGPDAPRPVIVPKWRLGDVRHIVASPRKAARGLNFVADVALEDGVHELATTSMVSVTPH
jgi:dTDP-L-rhamnose 4-epimerase